MKPIQQLKNLIGMDHYDQFEAEATEEKAPPAPAPAHKPHLRPSKQTTVVFRELFKFDHADDVCEAVMCNCIVICNMQRCSDAEIRRIIDFVSGTCFALHSNFKRIGDRLFIVAPQGVPLEGIYDEDLSEAMAYAESLVNEGIVVPQGITDTTIAR